MHSLHIMEYNYTSTFELNNGIIYFSTLSCLSNDSAYAYVPNKYVCAMAAEMGPWIKLQHLYNIFCMVYVTKLTSVLIYIEVII